MVGKYFLNILISIDQLGNTFAGGDPDETISSRLGKIKRKHNGKIPWYKPMAKTICYLLCKVDPGHCIDAIEEDEGEDAILKKKLKG